MAHSVVWALAIAMSACSLGPAKRETPSALQAPKAGQREPASVGLGCLTALQAFYTRTPRRQNLTFDEGAFRRFKLEYRNEGLGSARPSGAEEWLALFEANSERKGLLDPLDLGRFLQDAERREKNQFKKLFARLAKPPRRIDELQKAFTDYYRLVHRAGTEDGGYLERVYLARFDQALKSHSLVQVLSDFSFVPPSRLRQRVGQARKGLALTLNLILNGAALLRGSWPVYLPQWQKNFSEREIQALGDLIETKGVAAARVWFLDQSGPRARAEQSYQILARIYNGLILAYFAWDTLSGIRHDVEKAQTEGRHRVEELKDIVGDLNSNAAQVEQAKNKLPDEVVVDAVLDRMREEMTQSRQAPAAIEAALAEQRKTLIAALQKN